MTINRNAKAIDGARDFCGNVDITLTMDEMFQIYYSVKRFLLKKDIQCMLDDLIDDRDDGIPGLDYDNTDDFAEQIVDVVEDKMDDDDYYLDAGYSAMYNAVRDVMGEMGVDL